MAWQEREWDKVNCILKDLAYLGSLMGIALEIRMMYCRRTHSRQRWLSAWPLGLQVTAHSRQRWLSAWPLGLKVTAHSSCAVVMRTLWPETRKSIPRPQPDNSDTILSISPVRTVAHQKTSRWQYVKRMTSLWVWLELLASYDKTDMNSLLIYGKRHPKHYIYKLINWQQRLYDKVCRTL